MKHFAKIATYVNLNLGLLFILCLNLILRTCFIFYGYITHDEGIAFYNAKLAYSGLVPFIDYNGWNSFVSDYIFGLPRLFTAPTILSQRVFALTISILVFCLTLGIARRFKSPLLIILTSLLLTFGSLTYTYYSNIPFSEQLMTLFVVLSLFFLSKKVTHQTSFLWDYLSLACILMATFVRIQTLPLIALFFFYLIYLKKWERLYIWRITIALFGTVFLLYFPFFQLSWEHALYGLFWPFFSSKILIYVWEIPKINIGQLTTFALLLFRDYSTLFSLIFAGSVTVADWKKIPTSSSLQFMGVTLLVIFEFVIVAIVHRPIEAYYIYPIVPIMAFLAAFFLDSAIKKMSVHPRLFIIVMLLMVLITHFVTFPHYKFMKTSLKTISRTPHDLLSDITNYLTTKVHVQDEVVAFYLPAIAHLNVHVPLYLNEGPGSLSIADESTATKFHLTTLSSFRSYLDSGKAKILIFPSRSTYFFGKDDIERQQTQAAIDKSYVLDKEFTELSLIDGAKSSLLIYRLSE